MKRIHLMVGFWLGLLLVTACTEDDGVNCDTSTLQVQIVSQNPTLCDQNSGEVVLLATGGNTPYEYKLNVTAYSANASFGNLRQGQYMATVKDATGCESNLIFTIESEFSNLQISSIETENAGCGSTNGSITVNALGNAPFQYRINTASFSNSNIFSDLPADEYTVTIQDDLGCEISTNVLVPSGVSFSAQVEAILSTNCAISNCHNGSSGIPNFTNFSEIQSNASSIRVRTQDGSMPPSQSGLSLTNEEKNLIACWIGDGAPDN